MKKNLEVEYFQRFLLRVLFIVCLFVPSFKAIKKKYVFKGKRTKHFEKYEEIISNNGHYFRNGIV